MEEEYNEEVARFVDDFKNYELERLSSVNTRLAQEFEETFDLYTIAQQLHVIDLILQNSNTNLQEFLIKLEKSRVRESF